MYIINVAILTRWYCKLLFVVFPLFKCTVVDDVGVVVRNQQRIITVHDQTYREGRDSFCYVKFITVLFFPNVDFVGPLGTEFSLYTDILHVLKIRNHI